MANIIIAHDDDEGERWHAFNRKGKKDRRDIKTVVKEVWENQLRDFFECRDINVSCGCIYPSEISKTRPLTKNQLKRYQGCLVDLDSYENKFPYLIDEVNHITSLQGKIFPGGISKFMNSHTSIDKNWFPRPIKDDNDIADYLETLVTVVIASFKAKNDPESAEGLYQIFDKAAAGMGRYRRGE